MSTQAAVQPIGREGAAGAAGAAARARRVERRQRARGTRRRGRGACVSVGLKHMQWHEHVCVCLSFTAALRRTRGGNG